MGFLAPIFITGAGLLVIPWLVHRIRRPEREPIRFSSLMFVPEIKREVVERKRIQHILLMLLRMLLLLLLALAYARPYWAALAVPGSTGQADALHVILLDTSYSMGCLDWFEQAKARAREIVGGLSSRDRVSVITFAESAIVAAPFFDSAGNEAGGAGRARAAIDEAALSWRGTNYLSALQLAESELKEARERFAGHEPNRVVHLVTDFQRAGMPGPATGWKLSPEVLFNPIVVGSPGTANAAVTEVSVAQVSGEALRVRAKVKNWSADTAIDVPVSLEYDGEVRDQRNVAVPPGNASQVVFTASWSGTTPLDGVLRLPPDALAADNVRYFAWNPQPKLDVVLLTHSSNEAQWSAAHFVRLALPESGNLPWILRSATPEEFAVLLKDGAPPDIVLAMALNSMLPEDAATIRAYVDGGGKLLLAANSALASDEINRLLDGTGVLSKGARQDEPNSPPFLSLASVDLEHPIFLPFRGAQSNDFSPIRFHAAQELIVEGAEVRVLARFDDGGGDGGLPAMLETAAGTGRIIVWAFGADARESTLPKSTRFVPLLHETLAYLAPERGVPQQEVVGSPILPPPARGEMGWERLLPGEEDYAPLDPAETFSEPGFLRWRLAESSEPSFAVGVNVPDGESNPTRVDTPEFEIRLCAAPALDRGAPDTETAPRSASVVEYEYGRWLLTVLLGLLLVESVYAARLAARAA